MEPQIKQLTETVEQVTSQVKKGFEELKNAQELAQKSGTEAAKKMVADLSESVTKQFEALQDEQGKIKAAVERVGTAANENDPEKKAQRAAFVAFMRKGDIKYLSPDQQKAMSTDSLDNGGYLVPAEALGIINGRLFETSPLRRIANVVTTSAKSVEMVIDDQEAGFAWAGEGDAISATSTPTLGRLEIAAHKAIAYPSITEELVADAAFDVEKWLAGKISDKISRGENTAFASGNGVSAPRGFLTYTSGSSSYVRGQVEQVNMGSTSAPTEAGLIAVQGSLKEDYQGNAVWAMKRSTLVAIMGLNGSTNFRFLQLQPAGVQQKGVLDSGFTLLGKPVVLMDDLPTIGSASLSIAYGDFSRGYTIVDRAGLSVRADPYTAPGFIKYYATKRTGGAVTNFEAIKLSKFS